MECLVEYNYLAEEEDELTLTKGDRITEVVTMHDGWWEGTLNGKRGLFPDNFVKVITPNSGVSPGSIVEGPSKSWSGGDAPKMREKPGSGPHPRRLRAIFSYAPVQDDELKLDVGDVIEFMNEIEEGWWKGASKGRVGIFPSNFVAELDKEENLSTKNGAVSQEGSSDKGKARNRDTFIAKNKVIPDIIPAQSSKDEDTETAPKLPPKPGTGVRETARCFYPYFAANDDELTLQEGDIITIISKECEDEGWWRGELRGKTGVFPDNFVEIVTPNSPTTTGIASIHQPKVTAQERTDDSKKEARNPVETTMMDGIGASKAIKFENKISSQIKNFSKKEGSPAKCPVPPSPISSVAGFSGFNTKRDTKSAVSSPSTEVLTPDELNLNSIERNEKLSHLTASRAKGDPKRRPPSAVISREDELQFGMKNGSVTMTIPMQPLKESDNMPSSLRTNSHLIHVPDVSSPKEASPVPHIPPTAVNKPKTAIPWMAELKLKQDTKKTSASGSPTTPTAPSVNLANNNISTVVVSPPSSSHNPPSSAVLGQVKAPPLPAKPSISTSVPQLEKPAPAANTTYHSPGPANVLKHGVGMLKRNTSNPTAMTNHVNQSVGNGEFVSMEDHSILKERVAHLENEVEALQRQLKALIEKDHSNGHIV